MNRAHAGVFVRWRRPSVATWVWKFPCSAPAFLDRDPRVRQPSTSAGPRPGQRRCGRLSRAGPGFAGDPAGRRGRFEITEDETAAVESSAASPAPVAAKPRSRNAAPSHCCQAGGAGGAWQAAARSQRIKPQWRAARASRPHPATGASALTTRSSRRLYLNTDRASRRTVRRSSHSSHQGCLIQARPGSIRGLRQLLHVLRIRVVALLQQPVNLVSDA